MTTQLRYGLIAAIVLAALLADLSSPAAARVNRLAPRRQDQAPQEKKDSKSQKEEEKKQKLDKKAQKVAEKNERDYQMIKDFAKKKYGEDPEFKDEVDQAFDDVRRQHSEHAFLMNTLNAQDERITHTGDKIKTEDTLYDNPLVQDYVNRVGQSLVPSNSPHLFAFKVILNPIPEARSLSTGTVYISSGLLSMIDNEAQLAYLLAHEVAHVEKSHWYEDALVANGLEEYNEERAKKRKFGVLGIGLGVGILGGAASNSFGAGLQYGLFAAWGAGTALKFIVPNKVISWDKRQEEEADRLGLQYMFQRNYDPREVPKLYARLKNIAERDKRAQMGFMADLKRLGQRITEYDSIVSGLAPQANATFYRGSTNLRAKRAGEDPDNDLYASAPPPGKNFGSQDDIEARKKAAINDLNKQQEQIKAKLAAGELVASSGEFEAVMADLKRDNGVRAFYYDMFQMAHDNLKEALQLRSNDPYTHFYFGKLKHQTARTPKDRADAIKAFEEAIKQDRRGALAEPHLYLALAKMAEQNPEEKPAIIKMLQSYVEVYQQEHGGALPPNMDVIYAYLKDAEEHTWVARRAINISTKGLEPIGVSGDANTGEAPPQAAPAPNPTPAPAPPPAPAPQSKPDDGKGKKPTVKPAAKP